MRTLLRGLVQVLVALWVGGILFFPVVAYIAFRSLRDTHTAGTIARQCLHTLHVEGLIAGLLLIPLLLIGGVAGAYGRRIIGPVTLTLVMLGLTAFSQYSIMPRMEQDRLRSGGRIDATAPNDASRLDFERLHVASERVEAGVLVAGLLLILMLARAPLPPLRRG